MLALLAALVRRFDRFEQRNLGKDDISLERAQAHERADALLELVVIAGEFVDHALEYPAGGLSPPSNVDWHRRLLAIDFTAIFGDRLDPRRIDPGGVSGGVAFRPLRPKLGEDGLGDHVGGIFSQELNVPVERTARIVSGKPRAHHLIGQLLQLSSLATHRSALRFGYSSVEDRFDA